MKKIILVAGTRPDFVMLAPLYFELKKFPGVFRPLLANTGEHDDPALSDVFFREFGLPSPDFSLKIGRGTDSVQTAKAMMGIEQILLPEKPDLVLLFGSSNSSLGVGLCASRLNLSFAHINAGKRSNDRTCQMEINRIVIDLLSDLMLTSCDEANLNLIKEGKDEKKVYLAGNLLTDTLKNFLPRANNSEILDRLNLENEHYVLTTFHKPENIYNDENLLEIVNILTAVAEKVKTVLPLHPYSREVLESNENCRSILNNLNISVTEPLGYTDFIKLEKNAKAILTDSEGVQDEATYLGIPCMTLREITESSITLTHGTNRLVGRDCQKVIDHLDYILKQNRISSKKPILWDGQTAERIVRILKEYFAEEEQRSPEQSRAASEQYSNAFNR